MGIYIYLDVSFSVTREEWEAVYLETLELVNVFPLCEVVREEIEGEAVCRMEKSRERVLDEDGNIGWRASGDLENLKGAEEFILPKKLFTDMGELGDEILEDDIDALIGQAAYEGVIRYNDKRRCNLEKIWAGNTMGEKYHLYVLAIACLIVDRLGKKTSVYGNITAGQCRRAVRMANAYLSRPIRVPPQCDLRRFAERVFKMSLSGSEAMEFYMQGYLGKRTEETGRCAALYFSKEQIQGYWLSRLKRYPVGSIGYQEILCEYITEGYELDDLCSMVKLLEPAEVKGQYYKNVIESILELRIHHKKAGVNKTAWIDQDDEEPYGVGEILGQVLFEEKMRYPERYIPLESIVYVLTKELGERCPIAEIFQDYLRREEE